MKLNQVRIAALTLAMLAFGSAGAGTLSEARGQISDLIAEPAKMTAVVRALSSADQLSFVAEVNAALNRRPGTLPAKMALFVSVNKAMLVGAEKKNLKPMIAKIFETMPLQPLAVAHEAFAKDLLDLTSTKVTDAQFAALAESVVKAISEQVAKTGEPAERTTLGILMFLKAPGLKLVNLEERLVTALPEEVREDALKTWIPQGMKGSYESMLVKHLTTVPALSSELLPRIRTTYPELLNDLVADIATDVHVVPSIYDPAQNAEPIIGRDNEVPIIRPESQGYNNQK